MIICNIDSLMIDMFSTKLTMMEKLTSMQKYELWLYTYEDSDRLILLNKNCSTKKTGVRLSLENSNLLMENVIEGINFHFKKAHSL